MSVTVEITNQANLKKAKALLGAKTDSETLELALERVIDEFEAKKKADEDFDFDVHSLNRIPPKKTIRVKANLKIGGRRKPMKYDLDDYNFDGEE